MRKNLIIAVLCAGAAAPSHADTLSPFVKNVLTHVMLHEMAHGLIREFDLPVVANEEDMADSFATSYINMHFDERKSIITDRTDSWFYEAAQDDPADLRLQSEHAPDIRRAYRTLCLLYGMSPADYGDVVDGRPFSERDLTDCGEIGEQTANGWMRTIAPLQTNAPSQNVVVSYDDVYLADAVQGSGVLEEVARIARRFDWPEQITLALKDCGNGTGAYWSRSTRTITLCDSYVDRFQSQDFALNP